MDSEYLKFIENNINMIKDIESTPGQIKRLVEYLLFTLHTYNYSFTNNKDISKTPIYYMKSKEELILIKKLFIIKIIQFKWNDIYQTILISSKSNRKKILDILQSENFDYNKFWILKIFFRSLSKKQTERLIRKYSQDDKLIRFLKEHHNMIDEYLISFIHGITKRSNAVSNSIDLKITDDTMLENVQKYIQVQVAKKRIYSAEVYHEFVIK